MKTTFIVFILLIGLSLNLKSQDFDYKLLLGKWKMDHQFTYTQNQLSGAVKESEKVMLWEFVSLSKDQKKGKVTSKAATSKNAGKEFDFELDTSANRIKINNGVFDMIYVVSKLSENELHFLEVEAKIAGNRQLVPSGNLNVLHYRKIP